MLYPHIFEALSVKGMTLRNRIVMPPIGTNFAGLDGHFTQEHIDYYTQRAKGGTGLIILENVCVDYPLGTNGTTQLRIDNEMFVPGLYKFTEAMHGYGACVSVQLNHAGASAYALRLGGVQQVSSSDQPSKSGGATPRPLTVQEIHSIVDKFGEAAERARRAGFDSVEIHAGHSYLLSQFLSPIYNRRKDEFGGSAENRARIVRLVIDATRKAVGPNFPIGLRVSADELQEEGNSLEDTLIFLEYLHKEVDIINVSAGLNDCLQYQIDKMSLPDGWRAYMAKAIKEKFGKITIASGNFRSPAVAEKALREGQADLVAMGRGLIAEPAWANKVRDGREHLLRKCISCNIGCADHRIGKSRPIRCTVNPDLIYEDAHKRWKIRNPVNIAVIGGGTAGLEAACTAAEMGCDVYLFEATNGLGGLAASVSQLPDKRRLGDFAEYLRHRAQGLPNLHVCLNSRANKENLQALQPDLIVVATGSTPLLPPIAGLHEQLGREGGKVFSITRFIQNIDSFMSPQGKKIAVVGGGAVGLDVVEHFATRGAAEVAVIEMLPAVGRDLDFITKIDVSDMLQKYGVKQYLSTALKEVRASSFMLQHETGAFELNFDYGFVCLGMRSANSLAAELRPWCLENNIRLVSIGDAKSVRRIIDGVREGRDIANLVRYIDALKSELVLSCQA